MRKEFVPIVLMFAATGCGVGAAAQTTPDSTPKTIYSADGVTKFHITAKMLVDMMPRQGKSTCQSYRHLNKKDRKPLFVKEYNSGNHDDKQYDLPKAKDVYAEMMSRCPTTPTG